MYTLQQSLASVRGVGPATINAFAAAGMHTVLDLLMHIPLRYEDRSHHTTISQLQVGQVVTLTGHIINPRSSYRGRCSFQSATLVDSTGKVKLLWFNNPHIIQRFTVGTPFLVSGKLGERGTITQPSVEVLSQESIHTGRLVPMYSAIPDLPAGTVRRLMKTVIDQLDVPTDTLAQLMEAKTPLSLVESLRQLHFPDNEASIIQARERLAIEEVVQLILRSQALKAAWRSTHQAPAFPADKTALSDHQLPFALTSAQQRALREILTDMQSTTPMNRLLLGDVGSGKTAVAALACQHVLQHEWNACLIAPTQILAEQHLQTITRLFPDLPTQLVTGQTQKTTRTASLQKQASPQPPTRPTLFVGTHAILSRIDQINPGLIIYDEQHRFGVRQRSIAQSLSTHPHLLTLTATPIPRTLLLTIFSHLSLSIIDELPPGRLPVKSWLVPQAKRHDGYSWVARQLAEAAGANQALVVCPFIDPSHAQALENVAAATALSQELAQQCTQLRSSLPRPVRTELLHGRMSKKEQQEITQRLFAQEIDLLVTTPIIEVGLDLPAASIIVIEAAERFGLASLHQLRGRVGRAGQQAYCLLLTTSQAPDVQERLRAFCATTNGLELAEQDLARRGAGDIFGTQQHGLDQLIFANWTNLTLVTQAKQLADQLGQNTPAWHSLLAPALSADLDGTTLSAN